MCIKTKELLGINDNSIKIINIKEIKEKDLTVKYIHIIKTNRTSKCPICNTITNIKYDIRKVRVTHLKSANYNTYIILHKRRFKCKFCNKVFTENFKFIGKRKRVSSCVSNKIKVDLKDNVSFKYVAKQNNTSTTYVRNMFDESINYDLNVTTFPKVISFDEFKADTNAGKYACIINDPINKETIDILPTRKKEDIIKYLKNVENKENVEYVISDMYKPYLDITLRYFKNAKYVVDRFHYVRYIMSALDTIRINLQKYYLNTYNKNIYNLLKTKRNVSLLRKYSDDVDWLKPIKYIRNNREYYKMPEDILNDILDIDPILKEGYELKEKFLKIVKTTSYDQAEEQLKEWIHICFESNIEPFMDAAETIRNWLPYIVNSFIDKRFSNGYTEGINNKIKSHKRVAFGYRQFYIMRDRLLYILGKNLQG